MKQYCIYTTLFGGYEKLNEQITAMDSDIDFICFTDNKEITSETWKIKKIEPIFPFDSSRSSRLYKIKPHLFLKEYRTSLYIDNSIVLKIKPEEIFEDLMDEQSRAVFIHHSFRDTVLDEFGEVLKLNLDHPSTVLEQLDVYYRLNPEILNEKPIFGGFIIRDHHNPHCISAMEDWLAQVYRYSRRDQLSINYVLNKNISLKYTLLDLDIRSNQYFSWPCGIRYGTRTVDITKEKAANSNVFILSKIQDDLQNCNQQLQTLTAQISERENNIQVLSAEVAKRDQQVQILYKQLIQTQDEVLQAKKEILEYASSASWKLTEPFRKFKRFFVGRRAR